MTLAYALGYSSSAPPGLWGAVIGVHQCLSVAKKGWVVLVDEIAAVGPSGRYGSLPRNDGVGQFV